jgi:tripartite-type tricarboxylate transporter receptor subunit TctC
MWIGWRNRAASRRALNSMAPQAKRTEAKVASAAEIAASAKMHPGIAGAKASAGADAHRAMSPA